MSRRLLIPLLASAFWIPIACGGGDGGGLSFADASPDQASSQPAVEAGTADGSEVPDDATPDANTSVDADATIPSPYSGGVCNALAASPPVPSYDHVLAGTALTYATNPPSSGTHYFQWADFHEFPNPVPDGYLVHSMEHGAVVLFYKCTGQACTEVQTKLRAIRDAVPNDPVCIQRDGSDRRIRIIIVPRPTLDVPVAAAAWGQTYKADCVDPVTLQGFVNEYYAKGPENFCNDGVNTFESPP